MLTMLANDSTITLPRAHISDLQNSLPRHHHEKDQKLLSPTPLQWRAALRVLQDISNKQSKKPYSTANDKAAVLWVVLTSSLGRVSVWMKTHCSVISLLVSFCDCIASYRSVKRKQTAEVGGWCQVILALNKCTFLLFSFNTLNVFVQHCSLLVKWTS